MLLQIQKVNEILCMEEVQVNCNICLAVDLALVLSSGGICLIAVSVRHGLDRVHGEFVSVSCPAQ